MNCTLTKRSFLKNLTNYCRYKSTQSSSEYCLDLIRKHDYENFICTILMKNSQSRNCAIAIRSFNIEVSRVAQQVSQSNIGLMRLKFWEETIDKCYGNNAKAVPNHPVAIELYKVLTQTKLSKRYLNNLVKCRQEYIALSRFTTLDDLEKYAEQSVSNVYYLILEGCGVRHVHADHAASHLGKAQGIVQLIKTIPSAKQLNFLSIPQDVLIKNNLSQEEVFRGRNSEHLTEAVFEVASKAHQHVEKAKSLQANVPKACRAALLPAECVSSYLNRLERVNYDVFHPYLQQRPWKLLPNLWWNNFRNIY